ncbi:hypothetical protein LTR94_031026, partial [Friedmanniomyces endolithicus]
VGLTGTLAELAREIAYDEIAHVTALRSAITTAGGAALLINQPAINIDGGTNGAFTAAARAAGLVGATETLPVTGSNVSPAGTVAPGASAIATVDVVAGAPFSVSPARTFSTLLPPSVPLTPPNVSFAAAITPATTVTRASAVAQLVPAGVPGLTETAPVAVSKVSSDGTVEPGATAMVTVPVVAA